MVIVNQLGGLIVVPKMVTNSSVMLLNPQVAINPTTLLAPEVMIGVTDDAKKYMGYMRVMVPPEGMGVDGANVRVAGTKDFPTTRSDDSMVKDGELTCDNMPPDATGSEASTSLEVCTVTSTEPDVTGPIVNPLKVTTNTLALILAPDNVAIRAVAPVLLQIKVSPATLLAPYAMNGLTD